MKNIGTMSQIGLTHPHPPRIFKAFLTWSHFCKKMNSLLVDQIHTFVKLGTLYFYFGQGNDYYYLEFRHFKNFATSLLGFTFSNFKLGHFSFYTPPLCTLSQNFLFNFSDASHPN